MNIAPRLKMIRHREVQALLAGISRKDWHAVEVAANCLRDQIDGTLRLPANDMVTIRARDGIEAQHGLNDVYPGDPYQIPRPQLEKDHVIVDDSEGDSSGLPDRSRGNLCVAPQIDSIAGIKPGPSDTPIADSSEAGRGGDTCQCPKCGRMHRNLGFGTPPSSLSASSEDVRVPLHELQADVDYLLGRVVADGSCATVIAESIKSKLSKIEQGVIAALSAPVGEPSREAVASMLARMLYNDATLDNCTESERESWLTAADAIRTMYRPRPPAPAVGAVKAGET